jgi:hypothetical protein
MSLKPTEKTVLAPAPCVRETDYISEILRNDQTPLITDFQAQPLNVLTNYRGVMLYCAGGVSVHRVDPKTNGGHGFVAVPQSDAEEDVIISSSVVGRFSARVKFVE